MNRKILSIIIIAVLAAGFGGGLLYAERPVAPEVPDIQRLVNREEGKVRDIDFSLFWRVWNDLHDKYVDADKLDTQQMVYGAIKGMVDSVGDPYTVFLEPSTAKKFQEEISGSFGGVGIEIGMKANILTVIAPIRDTPAYKAGLKAGDKILKIDSQSTVGMVIDEAVSHIRGKIGTKVMLTVSDGDGKARDMIITRATITVPTVAWEMLEQNGKKIAYLQVFQFNQNVDAQFKKAAGDILKANPQGIVLDLRNNPGGLLDSSIHLAGYFIERGRVVVSEAFSDGAKNEFKSDGDASLKKFPAVALVNNGSASASEILAGAIHDQSGIKLVGEKTFGKGSVQELDSFGDNSSLKVTVAKWFTPAGVSISDKGIAPDIKVELTEAEKITVEFGNLDKDPQLAKALDLLK